jgi:hypothetical protein
VKVNVPSVPPVTACYVPPLPPEPVNPACQDTISTHPTSVSLADPHAHHVKKEIPALLVPPVSPQLIHLLPDLMGSYVTPVYLHVPLALALPRPAPAAFLASLSTDGSVSRTSTSSSV